MSRRTEAAEAQLAAQMAQMIIAAGLRLGEACRAIKTAMELVAAQATFPESVQVFTEMAEAIGKIMPPLDPSNLDELTQEMCLNFGLKWEGMDEERREMARGVVRKILQGAQE